MSYESKYLEGNKINFIDTKSFNYIDIQCFCVFKKINLRFMKFHNLKIERFPFPLIKWGYINFTLNLEILGRRETTVSKVWKEVYIRFKNVTCMEHEFSWSLIFLQKFCLKRTKTWYYTVDCERYISISFLIPRQESLQTFQSLSFPPVFQFQEFPCFF